MEECFGWLAPRLPEGEVWFGWLAPRFADGEVWIGLVVATQEIDTLSLACSNMLREQMDTAMQRFKTAQPIFWASYRQARKIVDYGTRHASNDSIIGKVTSKNDGASISKVSLRLTGNGVDRTVESTKLGNFRFPVVADGQYVLTATKDNFETVVDENIEVLDGKPALVLIAMTYTADLLDVPAELQSEENITPVAEENNSASKAA